MFLFPLCLEMYWYCKEKIFLSLVREKWSIQLTWVVRTPSMGNANLIQSYPIVLDPLQIDWHIISLYNISQPSPPPPSPNHTLQKNKGNDYQLKKLLIVKQILLVITLGNVKRTVWRICILKLGCREFTHLEKEKCWNCTYFIFKRYFW